jgi:hypothetical protein
MTDSEINATIAEACGWEILEDPILIIGCACYAKNPYGKPECGVPDYCRDLNAIHELESLYIEMDEWWSAYLEHIGSQWSFKHQAHAPARQRAEAFLKTIGKWKL